MILALIYLTEDFTYLADSLILLLGSRCLLCSLYGCLQFCSETIVIVGIEAIVCLIGFCGQDMLGSCTHTAYSGIHGIAYFLHSTQISQAEVGKVGPIQVGIDLVRMSYAHLEGTIGHVHHQAVLITSCIECISSTLSTMRNVSYHIVISILKLIVGYATSNPAVHHILSLIGRDNVLDGGLQEGLVLIHIEHGGMHVGVNLTTHSVCAIHHHLIEAILGQDNCLVEVEGFIGPVLHHMQVNGLTL